MQQTYRLALLHPAPRDDAERQHNDGALGPTTLGIEVTVPELATRCGLGNIDPQHSGGADPRAAIEACLEHEPLPAFGSWLVTIRPDLDALGGMAIFELRSCGWQLTPVIRARFRLIAMQDKFAFGPWPGPKAPPRTLDEFVDHGALGRKLAPLAAAAADYRASLDARVGHLMRWLCDGNLPEHYRRAVEHRAAALQCAILSGAAKLDTAAHGRIAVARGEAEGLLHLGYRLAPVVVAFNPGFRFRGGEPHAKFTIAQYQLGYVDLAGVVADLLQIEPGWGGSRTIIGSPQGRTSRLTTDIVIATVEKWLRR